MVSERDLSSPRISAFLDSLPSPDVEGARERVLLRLEERLQSATHRRRSEPWWRGEIRLPVPVLFAAASALVILAALVIASPFNARPTISDVASGGEQLDIKVHVDAEHTAELLDWLNSQDVGSITIQLPETAEFAVHGEPVLTRPDQLMIQPLEEESKRE